MTYAANATVQVLTRADDHELLGDPGRHIRLITDGSATGGALSTIRVRLGAGDPGADPHVHRRCTELFYVLSGEAVILAGDRTVQASSGDQVVVPPGLDHAFAAGAGRGCELLVVFAPGLDRFGYFRTLIHVARGELPPERLREVAPGYDTFFTRSPAWGRH